MRRNHTFPKSVCAYVKVRNPTGIKISHSELLNITPHRTKIKSAIVCWSSEICLSLCSKNGDLLDNLRIEIPIWVLHKNFKEGTYCILEKPHIICWNMRATKENIKDATKNGASGHEVGVASNTPAAEWRKNKEIQKKTRILKHIGWRLSDRDDTSTKDHHGRPCQMEENTSEYFILF